VKFYAADDTQFRVSVFYRLCVSIDNRYRPRASASHLLKNMMGQEKRRESVMGKILSS
jgi:hypothetical protein